MSRLLGGYAATLAVIATMVIATPTASAQTTVPALDHVVVIVMENLAFDQIIGNPSAPYINSLAQNAGLATNYYAVAHPSLPNYLALAGGNTFGITTDCTTCWVSSANVADSIEASGKTWKAYEEGMPSPCYVGDSYPYVQKHDPFIYFNDIRTNAARCQSHVVPFTQLATDFKAVATTPGFSFVTPDMCHDMHDCSIATGDSWLQQQIPQILTSPAFTTQRSLLALLWDEDDFTTVNKVPLIVAGTGIAAGTRTATVYNHYSLLHTIVEGLGASTVGLDGATPAMADVFSVAGWSPVGGVISSDPAAASWGQGHLDVFVQGQDRALWHRAWNGTSWQSWESLGGVMIDHAGTVSRSTNTIDVFVRGQDNALWYRLWNGTAWGSWSSMGGVLTGGPSASYSGATRLDVFVRGQDNALWHRWWNGTSWQPWESLGGVLSSDAGAVSTTANSLDVFVRGQDGALWHRAWNGSSWGPWQGLGGVLYSNPDVSSCAAGKLDVFVRGQDNALWRRSFDGVSWGSWSSLGGQWTSGPAAVCEPSTTTIDLLERGPDNSLWQRTTS